MRTRIIFGVIIVLLLTVLAGLWLHRRPQPVSEQVAQAPAAPANPAVVPPAMYAATTRTLPVSSAAIEPPNEQSNYLKSATMESIRGIVDLHGDAWPRQQAVRSLPKNLADEEISILSNFLRNRHDEDEGQIGHVLKSDLMDALVAQQHPATSLAELFAAIYADSGQNLVVRDYAVQHLALLAERLNESPVGWTDYQTGAAQKFIQETLWQIVAAPDTSISGTALIGLTRLSETDQTIDRLRLGDAALGMASGSTTQEASRITSYQVCARLGLKNALPLLTQVAEQGDDPMLRVSAVGALGALGDEPELAVIQRIIAAGNDRLKHAASMAFQRIQDRVTTKR